MLIKRMPKGLGSRLKNNYCLKNIRRLVTMDPNLLGLGVIENGAILVEEGKIKWVGKQGHLPTDTIPCDVYDMDEKVLTPGLIDCHTHLVFAGSRQDEYYRRSKGASYWEIAKSGGGILSTVESTRAATIDELYNLARLRIEEALLHGITTVEIKTGYGLDKQNEIKMAEVIGRIKKDGRINIKSTFLGAHAVPNEFQGRKKDYLKLLTDDIMPALVERKLIDACDVFVDKNAFAPDDARIVCRRAEALELNVHLHVDQFSDCDGGTLASELGALSADHLNFLSEAGAVEMAKSGVVGVVLPGSDFFAYSGSYPPVQMMTEKGVRTAIATNFNPGTNPSQNLILTAIMAVNIFKMTLDEAWRGITINAAHALGLENVCGSIEVGKRADFTVFNAPDEYYPLYSYGKNYIEPLQALS